MSKLDVAIDAFRDLESIEDFSRLEVSGRMSPDKYIKHKNILSGNDLLLDSDDVKRTICFDLPIGKNNCFCRSMSELIAGYDFIFIPPEIFYLSDIDFKYNGQSRDDLPDAVRDYFDTSKFASTLMGLCDYKLMNDRKAIFFHGEKLELSLEYDESDIVTLPDLDLFIDEFVESNLHKDQKAGIIKCVLVEMLRNNEINRLTLPCLLSRYGEFVERVKANYHLYVSDFSFQKIKEEIEKEKLEFTLKINKVFSDIQNQLLAVPLAVILVSNQLEQSQSVSINNFTIWCGVLIFGIFMSLLIGNQVSSLNSIRAEVDTQWDSLKRLHKFVEERLKSHYCQLVKRYDRQRNVLRCIDACIALVILGATLLFVFRSEVQVEFFERIWAGVIGGLVYLYLWCRDYSKKEGKDQLLFRRPLIKIWAQKT